MPVLAACACGASYTLKDEFAGQAMRCPRCGAALQAGTASVAAGAPAGARGPFDRDKFLLRQQMFKISEKYDVHDENGNPILFVQRPAHVGRNLLALFGTGTVVVVWLMLVFGLGAFSSPGEDTSAAAGAITVIALFTVIPIAIVTAAMLAPKRHVTFYKDESKAEKLLEVLQDKKLMIINATYTLRDATGQPIALFSKNYLFDVFRKRWVCKTPDGRDLCEVREDSILLSLLRRLLGPLFGLLRTNFVFLRGDEVIGEFNRKMTLFDRYVLDMSADRGRTLDRRIALAMGVMLDTGERR